ncbi:MAG: type II toxin-antitoxin system Phd/YefM family antitoxin [Eggerthellaceae bacterium]|nr:type II toxin-antitoxin system Phd/YefM family antitoxin [Eggerthellaceae bacterium]
MSTAIALSEAKAHLSALIREVEGEGARFTIVRNGRPVARLMPIAGGDDTASFGMLASYADISHISEEKHAWKKVVGKKHADIS